MRNQNGIEIRECCASCAHKQLTRALSERYCNEKRGKVKPCGWCEHWKLSNQLENAGEGSGQVKRLDYLKYAQDVQLNEPKCVEQMRKDFEQEHGSIYINI